MPFPWPPVVTEHVAGPVTGKVESGVQLTVSPSRSFPDFTHTESSVVPSATVNVTRFSLSDVIVMPGAGLNGGFWPSHLPSMVSQVSAG